VLGLLHGYFRSLNPALRIYARSNFQDELGHDLGSPGTFRKQFFGDRFNPDDVRSFKPDVFYLFAHVVFNRRPPKSQTLKPCALE